MNKVYLFVLVLLSASFTGCIESDELPMEEEDSSNIEDGPKYSSISRSTEYDSLTDCPNGGVIIEYGIDENGNGVIHKGISSRKFQRSFTISEDVKVKHAELKNGLLNIDLERIVPEEKKPRLISIN